MKFDLTPIQEFDGYFFKREDFYQIGSAIGGKARIGNALINEARDNGFKEIVTTGSRDSRQCEIVSSICEDLGIRCHLFMPSGKDTDVTDIIQSRAFSTIHRTKVGYNSVLISHSQKWANENNAYYIPFGMESKECIDINMHQVQNIPKDISRIVIPCGGGMQMISVIYGLKYYGMSHIKVLGVQVGANPKRVIDKFIPDGGLFGTDYNYEIVKSDVPYSKHLDNTTFCGIDLDPIYEAKCIPFLEKGDLLWIVGKRL